MKLLYPLLALFLACNLSPENKISVTLDKQVNKDTTIAKSVVEETFLYSLTPEDLNLLADKNYKILISKIIKKRFDFFNAGFIDTVVPFQKCNIKNYGRVEIYSASFSDKLPETFKRKSYLIINQEKKQGVIIYLDTLNFMKINALDSAMYLCGVNKVRTKGYFIVYDFFMDRFKTILNSLDDKFCSNGVIVYNNSADCVSYQNDFLKMTNVDVNNDGLLDIVFSGNALIYCKGLETGYGKLDRPPQGKIKLNIVFKAHQNGSTPTWTLVDSTFCNKIKY